MFIHTIVYVILSLLMATAAFASSVPVSKEPKEQCAAELDEEATDTVQK